MLPIRGGLAARSGIVPRVAVMSNSDIRGAGYTEQLRVNADRENSLSCVDPFGIRFNREKINTLLNTFQRVCYVITALTVCVVHKRGWHNKFGQALLRAVRIRHRLIEFDLISVGGAFHFKARNAKQEIIAVGITFFFDNDIFLNAVAFDQIIQINVALCIFVNSPTCTGEVHTVFCSLCYGKLGFALGACVDFFESGINVFVDTQIFPRDLL